MASLSFGKTKLRLLSTFMLALGLVVQPFGMVMANTAYAATNYSNGFETSLEDWTGFDGGSGAGTITRVAGGVPGTDGIYHAAVTGSVYTPWGGYESTFPINGYSSSVDVYLDMNKSDGVAATNHFDLSSAINNVAGTHLRDFVFQVGIDQSDPGKWWISTSNGASASSHVTSATPGAESVVSSGWYTFQTYFANNGSDVLEVYMSVYDRDNGYAEVGSWLLSTPTDTIPTSTTPGVVGGHRYGWFVNQPFTELPIDNAVLETILSQSCSSSSAFDSFSLGSVNGQGGWSSTGGYDQEIVENRNAYNYMMNGCKSLRLSNAVTSGGFGDQTFSPSVNEAGETGATNGGMSSGPRQSHYEAEFSIGTTQATQQVGLSMSVSPDRGDGSRMSYLGFVDGVAGLDVTFYDVQGIGNPANFVPTTVVTGLSRNTPHTIKFVIDFVDGPSNDVVKIYIDGALVHTGTTWENYYRYDTEASAEPTTRTIDSLLFRVSGTPVPANNGKGFLIDGTLAVSTSTPTPPAPTNPPTTGGSGGSGSGSGSTSGTSTTSTAGRGSNFFGTTTYDDSWMDGANTEEGETFGEVLSGGAAVSSTSTTDGDVQEVPADGIAWYWWLLGVALAAGAWTLIALLRNRRLN